MRNKAQWGLCSLQEDTHGAAITWHNVTRESQRIVANCDSLKPLTTHGEQLEGDKLQCMRTPLTITMCTQCINRGKYMSIIMQGLCNTDIFLLWLRSSTNLKSLELSNTLSPVCAHTDFIVYKRGNIALSIYCDNTVN